MVTIKMYTSKYNRWMLALVLTLALSACTLPSGTEATSPPTIPPPTEMPDVSKTPLSPPTAVDPVCVPPGAPDALVVAAFGDYAEAILDNVNAGVTSEGLDEALYRAGVANQPVAVATGDLTGDGKDDLIVSLFDPASSFTPPEGALFIYVCREGAYILAHEQFSMDGRGAPGILYVQDMNADGVAELVTSGDFCGAHTCFSEAQILGWDGEGFVNFLEGNTSDMPFPYIEIVDRDNDGFYDLEITGSGVASAGAGPPRGSIRVWSFDAGGSWLLTGETLLPSDYRIHVLHDADASAQADDYPTALDLYHQVVDDPFLEDWIDPVSEQANLNAYAYFKIVILRTLLGETVLADLIFDKFSETYSPETPQHAFVEMTTLFLDALDVDGQEAACAAVMVYAAEHDEAILVPLGSQVFGYGNRDYGPEDMCP